jgi:hypothetical protein
VVHRRLGVQDRDGPGRARGVEQPGEVESLEQALAAVPEDE